MYKLIARPLYLSSLTHLIPELSPLTLIISTRWSCYYKLFMELTSWLKFRETSVFWKWGKESHRVIFLEYLFWQLVDFYRISLISTLNYFCNWPSLRWLLNANLWQNINIFMMIAYLQCVLTKLISVCVVVWSSFSRSYGLPFQKH